MNIYQQQILENYKNPKNFGKPEWKPTHTYKLQNLTCGDEIEVFLRVEDNKITDYKFIAEGCSISIAAGSMISDTLLTKTLEEIRNLSEQDILEILGIELTPSRIKCGMLALEAVKGSIDDLRA